MGRGLQGEVMGKGCLQGEGSSGGGDGEGVSSWGGVFRGRGWGRGVFMGRGLQGEGMGKGCLQGEGMGKGLQGGVDGKRVFRGEVGRTRIIRGGGRVMCGQVRKGSRAEALP